MPATFERTVECVDAILARAGRRLVVGLPIGIGKPVPLVNELYRRALQDPSIDLTFLTGLSLARPQGTGELERRFLAPFVDRVFADCPELDYVEALRSNTLPANIRIIEFFLSPGSALGWPHSQMNYLATNYTQVARDLLDRGVNVILQLVAARHFGGERQYSLGANPDVTAELLPLLRARAAAGGEAALIVGEVHSQLPFMLGDAQLDAAQLDLLLEHPRYDYGLYGPPNLPIALTDHAIGLWCSGLLKDGGTLQLGIGELGDAVCYAAQLRHQQNPAWRAALDALAPPATRELIARVGGEQPFASGLFACSEMFVDQLLDLYRSGVLRRRVYPCLPLERALAAGTIAERFGDDVLHRLLDAGLAPRLDEAGFEALRGCGVFRAATRWHDGAIVLPEGGRVEADLSQAAVRTRLAGALGQRLRGGVVLQAAFLLGPRGFYAALRDLPEDDRVQFQMCAVGRVNALGEDGRELRRLQRRHGRFINTTMMMTLLGAAVSDSLDDGRVVSGVGGQLNFVMQAMDLPDARSILCVRATREKHGEVQSNIRFSYGSQTVPRPLRDIVVTEYGCVDLRGRTDAEVIAALLGVADSRFQPALLAQAQRHGKIARDFSLPDAQRSNTPQRLADGFRTSRAAGQFSEFPFGTDFTADEIELSHALRHLSQATAGPRRWRTLAGALLRSANPAQAACIERMGLTQPRSAREWLYRQLLREALYSMPRS